MPAVCSDGVCSASGCRSGSPRALHHMIVQARFDHALPLVVGSSSGPGCEPRRSEHPPTRLRPRCRVLRISPTVFIQRSAHHLPLRLTHRVTAGVWSVRRCPVLHLAFWGDLQGSQALDEPAHCSLVRSQRRLTWPCISSAAIPRRFAFRRACRQVNRPATPDRAGYPSATWPA